MKLIHNMIMVDLKNSQGETLIVNTLLGLIDVINRDEQDILLKWLNKNEIIPTNDLENTLYKELCDRQYIMTKEKEDELMRSVLERAKQIDDYIADNSKSVTFLLNYDCNFDCPYCYEKDVIQTQSMYTEEMVDKVFEIYKNGVEQIGFFGGEPLLPKNRKIVEYIYEKSPNAYYFAFTNGYYLEEYCDFFKKAKTRYIQVTLDGSKHAHNKTRILKNRQPTYDKIFNGIKKCLENSVPIKIRMNYTNESLDDCIKARDDLINEFKPYSQFLTFELQALFDTPPSQKWELYRKLYEYDINDKANDKYTLNQLHKTNPSISRFFEDNSSLRPLYNFCFNETQNRFYDINGDIYNCILAVGIKHKSVGTFFPKLQYKKNSMLTRNIENTPQCSKCRYKLICGGGCPNAVIGDDGNAFVPNCSSLKEQLDYVVPYLYSLRYGK